MDNLMNDGANRLLGRMEQTRLGKNDMEQRLA
jgi:hypothetical protein